MALDAAVEQAIGVGLLGVQARQELRARIECGSKQGEEGIGHGSFSAGAPWSPGAAITEKGDILRAYAPCVAVSDSVCRVIRFADRQAPALGFNRETGAERFSQSVASTG
jgi:hypothetical protein